MFTGLVEATGRLRRIETRGPGVRLTLAAPPALVAELTLGESVAVDGACLTVISAAGDAFAVDASGETMQRTTLGDRRPGDRVNLERALRMGDRLGGHLVAGHVDATGTIRAVEPAGEARLFRFTAPPEVARYLVPKGSIAVDGVSLTVNGVDREGFDVVLIPHTQQIVQLADKKPGERVNLEADLIGKYVERLLAWRDGSQSRLGEGVDLALLARAGFLGGGEAT
ncbi:MAG: riboflavin synthase [Myxococcales bacterium]|nr:riboflavin synthase [Myxococcales bacterium]